MGRRSDLHDILRDLLGSDHVYFQPPESIKLVYPCIIYKWANLDTKYADNVPYRQKRRYTITVIDKNPDSEIPNALAKLPLCKMDRTYPADNLNHFVFDLYY